MNRFISLVLVLVTGIAAIGSCVAAEGEEQAKTGTVRKLDVAGKTVTVMVLRELVFTVTDETKITKADKPAALGDIKVDDKVSVVYVKNEDTRTVRKIVVLAAEPVAAPTAAVEPTLAPGKMFSIQFPELPPTFAEQVDKKNILPMMTVVLPRNYDRQRKHPLLIFLAGGSGSRGQNPGVARSLAEGQDFVCVDLPLFKAKLETSAERKGPSLLLRDEDVKLIWSCYRTMLAKLEEVVPNLDPARRVLGGFSNGGHTTAGLIDQSDGAIARQFSAFVCVEGGGRLQHYELLKGKPFLMLYGSTKAEKRMQEVRAEAEAAGVQVTVHEMKGAGHAFPVSEYPFVRTWLRETVLK